MLGLAEHGDAVSTDRTGRSTLKVDQILEALDEADAELLRSWLTDPANWPPHRISRALKRMAQAEARPELSVSHSPIATWRMHNGITEP